MLTCEIRENNFPQKCVRMEYVLYVHSIVLQSHYSNKFTNNSYSLIQAAVEQFFQWLFYTEQ